MFCYFIYLSSFVALMAAITEMPEWLVAACVILQVVAMMCCKIIEDREESKLNAEFNDLKKRIAELEKFKNK